MISSPEQELNGKIIMKITNIENTEPIVYMQPNSIDQVNANHDI